MLPKKHRLSKTAEVTKTTAKGRSFFSPSFIIKYLVENAQESVKMTVIVSNKVSKSAVARNKIKRALRLVVQEHLSDMKAGNYAVVVKKAAISRSMLELKQELVSGLQKSKILKPNHD